MAEEDANLHASEHTPAERKSEQLGDIPRDHPRAMGFPSASINDPEYAAAAAAREDGGVHSGRDITKPGYPVEVLKDVDPQLHHIPAVQGDSTISHGEAAGTDAVTHGDTTIDEAAKNGVAVDTKTDDTAKVGTPAEHVVAPTTVDASAAAKEPEGEVASAPAATVADKPTAE